MAKNRESDPLRLDQAFHRKGWLLYAGNADEAAISGVQEKIEDDFPDRAGSQSPACSKEHTVDHALHFLKWLADASRFLTPYASIRYRIERHLDSHIFTRFSDRFSNDYATVVKYCPGTYKADLRHSAMYTVVTRREHEDRMRTEAWDMLHAFGHILSLHSLIRRSTSSEMRLHLSSYSKWLESPDLEYPRLGGSTARSVELTADTFAAHAIRILGRPMVDSGATDRQRLSQVSSHLGLPRSAWHRLIATFPARTWENDPLSSHSWLSSREVGAGRGSTCDVPARLLGRPSDADLSQPDESTEQLIHELLKGAPFESYAPFRTLIEFVPRILQDSAYFNLSVRLLPTPKWGGPIGVSRHEFRQMVESGRERDYTQYILEIPVPPRQGREWSEFEQLAILRSLCRVFFGLVSGSINKNSLASCSYLEPKVAEREDETVRVLTAAAFSIWQSPEDLFEARPWEISRAVIGSSPFVGVFKERGALLDPEIAELEQAQVDCSRIMHRHR